MGGGRYQVVRGREGGVEGCEVSVLWQALAIDDQYHHAWNGLGFAGGGVVGGTQYSEKQCYQQVLCRG